MTELNGGAPTQIEVIDGFSFKLKLDTTSFTPYNRQGIVENIKVPKEVSFHSLEQSLVNPVASSPFGMLETPDLRFFGRSEQLHLALLALWEYQKNHADKLPSTEEEVQEVLKLAKQVNETNKANEHLTVDELDESVVRNVA